MVVLIQNSVLVGSRCQALILGWDKQAFCFCLKPRTIAIFELLSCESTSASLTLLGNFPCNVFSSHFWAIFTCPCFLSLVLTLFANAVTDLVHQSIRPESWVYGSFEGNSRNMSKHNLRLLSHTKMHDSKDKTVAFTS